MLVISRFVVVRVVLLDIDFYRKGVPRPRNLCIHKKMKIRKKKNYFFKYGALQKHRLVKS